MSTATKERQILFNGQMVREILLGHKTQTRRLITPQPDFASDPRWSFGHGHSGSGWYCSENEYPEEGSAFYRCPFGEVGERLWVRESWRPSVAHGCVLDTCDCGDVNVHYPADGHDRFFNEYDNLIPDGWLLPKAADKGNVPSIHMPRWASRIDLEITGVLVERLQDIDELDALAEGVQGERVITGTMHESGGRVRTGEWIEGSARDGYAALWDQINGKGSWDLNPWVWAIEFKRINVN